MPHQAARCPQCGAAGGAAAHRAAAGGAAAAAAAQRAAGNREIAGVKKPAGPNNREKT